MKTYLVSNMYTTVKITEPEPMEEPPMCVQADSPEEAIEFVMDMILNHGNLYYITEREGNAICVYDLYGNFVEMMMDFVATEIEEG